MALDPEELKKRRQKRLQQKQEAAKQRKKMILRLAIVGGILLLCVALVFVLTDKESVEPTQTLPSEEPLDTQAVSSPTTVIHLAAGGDLNINDRVVAAGGNDYNYQNAFLDVGGILADADITVLNFEGNFCGAPYGSSTLSAPQSMATALRDVGVDALQLANSYPINQGMSGLAATINAVRSASMEPLGVYENQAAQEAGKGFSIREVNGIRIAFVAFTKGMNGMRLPAGSENCVNVLYSDYDSTYQTIDTEGISRVLSQVEKADPDLTVALLHWGSEFNNTVSASQERIVSLLQSQGVDAIIGTHSHYVQKMEFNPESGQFLAYSLGDFFSDAQRAGTEYSVILDLEITKDNRSGDTKITNYSYTPIFTVCEADKPARVVRIRETMEAYDQGYIDRISPETYHAMTYALERIEDRVTGGSE